MKKLVIVQPYIPKYRVNFFENLFERLAKDGIEGVVAAGAPPSQSLARGDSSSAPWHIQISTRNVRILDHTLTLGGSYNSWRRADAVIIGHLGSSLDTYRALLARRREGLRVGLWGHIKSYVNDSHPIDATLEKWQLRHADQVFAYTPGGADYAIQSGVTPRKITTVMNTVDTSALVQAMNTTTEESVTEFCRLHEINPERTLSYIGGLDESKRISFLVDTLDKLWSMDPSFRLLLAGHGHQSSLLDAACRRGQVIKLGYAGPELQTLMARSSRGLLMPGRIGLIAVEALVLNRPIITTNWKYHSAEIEYLSEGTSLITTPNDSSAYAEGILQFLETSSDESISKAPTLNYPTIEAMVENFADGVISMMGCDK